MDKDYKELIEYLGQRFTKVDNKLEKLEREKADKSDVQELMSAIDAYAKKADTYF